MEYTENRPIKVILVDDHQVLLDGLEILIEKEEDMMLLGTFDEGKKALTFVDEHHSQLDVAVLDISMPMSEFDGLDICKIIKKNYPSIKVMILTMHDQQRYITSLVAAGADGYILKNKGKEELIDGIRTLAKGEKFYGKEIVKIVFDRMNNQFSPQDQYGDKVRLTGREIEVLTLLGKGLSSQEVSGKLNIEKSTVETHKKNIREKLDLKNIREIIIFARENGYV